MKFASIDIGSNSVLLLIAEYDKVEKKLKTLRNEYKISRLAEHLEITGKITEKRIAKLAEIMLEYKNIIEDYSCSEIIITGSFALRKAENSGKIKDLVKNLINVNLKILTKKEEAFYSFLGCTSKIRENEHAVVIDIGGGSTEITHGKGRNLLEFNSFELGVVTLHDKFSNRFPFDEKTLNEISKYIKEKISDSAISETNSVNNVIAVAGTPTSLAAIKAGMKENYNEKTIENMQLQLQDIKEFIAIGKNTSGKYLVSQFGSILKGREDLLIYGSLILKDIMKQFHFTKLSVSGKGVRYGAIVSRIYELGCEIDEIA